MSDLVPTTNTEKHMDDKPLPRSGRLPTSGTLVSADVIELNPNTRVAVPVPLSIGVNAHLKGDSIYLQRTRYKVIGVQGRQVTVAPVRRGRAVEEDARTVKATEVQPFKLVSQKTARDEHFWQGFEQGFGRNPEEFTKAEIVAALMVVAGAARYAYKGTVALRARVSAWRSRRRVYEGSVAPEGEIEEEVA